MAAFQVNEALPLRATESERLSRWVGRDREDKRRDVKRVRGNTTNVRLGEERATARERRMDPDADISGAEMA